MSQKAFRDQLEEDFCFQYFLKKNNITNMDLLKKFRSRTKCQKKTGIICCF